MKTATVNYNERESTDPLEGGQARLKNMLAEMQDEQEVFDKAHS